jgi:ribose transport system ATP-binding protein
MNTILGSAALRLEHLSKSFNGVPVLRDVSLEVGIGEIHGLLGTNGAGKSTLVKILSGYHSPEPGGSLRLWDVPVSFPVAHPENHGMAFVHQNLGLVDNLSVLENLRVSAAYGSQAGRPISWRRERRLAAEMLEPFSLKVDIDQPITTVDPSTRSAIAIIRALGLAKKGVSKHALVVLDEPTVYFTPDERINFFRVIHEMAASGDSFILISHRLREVVEECDRATILRDGSAVTDADMDEVDEEYLVTQMLGYEIGDFYPAVLPAAPAAPLLRLESLSGGSLSDFSVELGRGEILGIAGVAGSGYEDLPAVLRGLTPLRNGRIKMLEDGTWRNLSPRRSHLAGVVVVPADRHRYGICSNASAGENVTLGALERYVVLGRLRPRAVRQAAESLLQQFRVQPARASQPIVTFSGGNQQKIVLARSLDSSPSVLVLHEATQGVDAQGKKDILELVKSAARNGVGVLVCSSDYEELSHICDRVAIVRDGAVETTLTGAEITENALLRLSETG